MSLPGSHALLLTPRGFCAGVDRAVQIVDQALDTHGPPVYVLHEIVHNRVVLERLRARGAVFTEELQDVPRQALLIFSAHGVSEAVAREARARSLRVIDATCPLVTLVHDQAAKYAQGGCEIVIVGHRDHVEVKGTRGRVKGTVHVVQNVGEVEELFVRNPTNLAYVTQTTLSMDDTREIVAALRARFPEIRGPDLRNICYATQNRQDAVRSVVAGIDLLIVIGSRTSANSERLREIGARRGIPSHLVERPADVCTDWLRPGIAVGFTAGASAPAEQIRTVIDRLRELGVEDLREQEGTFERVHFKLPDLAPPVPALREPS